MPPPPICANWGKIKINHFITGNIPMKNKRQRSGNHPQPTGSGAISKIFPPLIIKLAIVSCPPSPNWFDTMLRPPSSNIAENWRADSGGNIFQKLCLGSYLKFFTLSHIIWKTLFIFSLHSWGLNAKVRVSFGAQISDDVNGELFTFPLASVFSWQSY